jgi:hypothetical protein
MTLEGVEPGPSSHPTRRWRELDSNYQFRREEFRFRASHFIGFFGPYSSLGLRNQRFDSFSLPRKLGRTSTADACMRALTLPSIAALSGPC